jgi:hypothetical protein
MLLSILNPPRGRPFGGGGVHRILSLRNNQRETILCINGHYLLTKSLPNSDA